MKANLRKLETPIENAFHIRKDVRTHFEDNWHFHEMLELVVILKGKGKRYIGDSIEEFGKGDVILVGEKLPHVWRSEKKLKKPSKFNCSSIIIQFSKDFIGDKFLSLTESDDINTLFKRAEMGISFKGESNKILIQKIKNLLELDGMNRLLSFLDILHTASKLEDFSLLTSPMFIDTIYKADLKINKVFEYTMDNFTGEVTLDDVSELVFMNKTAFCRYFKKRTKKTFTSFLNEIRIGYACKLIREDTHSITQAAYSSGYNSPSHFNNQFRLIKKISPTEFYKNSKKIK